MSRRHHDSRNQKLVPLASVAVRSRFGLSALCHQRSHLTCLLEHSSTGIRSGLTRTHFESSHPPVEVAFFNLAACQAFPKGGTSHAVSTYSPTIRNRHGHYHSRFYSSAAVIARFRKGISVGTHVILLLLAPSRPLRMQLLHRLPISFLTHSTTPTSLSISPDLPTRTSHPSTPSQRVLCRRHF